MKKIFAIILFLVLFIGVDAAQTMASTIPDAELSIMKASFKKLNVRFDGVVELPDGVSYIPVYPVQEPKKLSEVKIIQTIPANKTFKDEPDFVMFNTNLALFKIVKDGDKKTIIYDNAIPYEVKMGIFPQDLLVPQGFQVPEDYKILIGDLMIPIKPTEEYREVKIEETIKAEEAPKVILHEQAAQQLANKYFYATSFNSTALSILNADTGKAFKRIDFLSIPSDIKLTNNGRYLLLSTIRNGKVFVVDTVKTSVVKELKVGEKPFFIEVSDADNLAYIANRADNTISVIDVKTMQPLDDIKVTGNPCYIALSDDSLKMYYLDAVTGIVYYLEKQDNYFKPYSAHQLFRANNISKIQLSDDKIYTLDRGENKLIVYHFNKKPQEEEMVNVSDITPATAPEKTETNVVDYNSYNEPEEIPFEEKEKLTFKQKVRREWRRLLYFPEDYEVKEQPLNPENQIVVFKEKQNYQTTIKTEDEDGMLVEEEFQVKQSKKVQLAKGEKKTFKQRWFEFLNYKAPVEPVTEIEEIKADVDAQMDFVSIPSRANDFIVIRDKIYLLCSDDYTVYVYDRNNNTLINSFGLDRVGYYNAIKVSDDKKIGIITNISSNAITLFDTQTDVIVDKLPITVNVHSVVITGKD
ncbi:MAG: YncE family protein [bacterium]|nr:YncE family protein [bacterium]